MDLGYQVHAVSRPADLRPAAEDGEGSGDNNAGIDQGSHSPRLDEEINWDDPEDWD